jgi:hypothetical protein
MEIRVYLEGGGAGANSRAQLRQGFDQLFAQMRNAARSINGALRFIPCGGRDETWRDFATALKAHPNSLNLLLVDSEELVDNTPREYVRVRDNWHSNRAQDEQFHLMVVTMESWVIVDRNALTKFYGQNFQLNALPRVTNIETVDKKTINRALSQATRATSKGEYHKIQHGPKIMGLIDLQILRANALHCEHFCTVIEQNITSRR